MASLCCQLGVAGSGANFGPSGPDLRDGKFHHVALSVVRSSTAGGNLYVDGASISPSIQPVARGACLTPNPSELETMPPLTATVTAKAPSMKSRFTIVLYPGLTSPTSTTLAKRARSRWTATMTISRLVEITYFGHLGVDPSGDADGDGLTNLQEFQRRH